MTETREPDASATTASERTFVERAKLWTVIAASSAGTLIEWYDFYIFGSLATIIATQFFPETDPTTGLLSTLAIFATGFIVRPFGALVFGRVGDLVGRKHAFMVTLVMMGLATFAIGCVPGYAQIGIAAPVLVLLLRMTQGLALGGEYGGAATYVAEHSPDHRRGYFTSYIQTTATLGLLVSIIVIVGGRMTLGKEAFEAWGWRVPFWLSSVLVVFSYVVRRKMQESPVFVEMKAAGKQSKNPWRDSFADPQNLKLVTIALFGAVAGQGVVWYTGQFYALYFLQTELKIEQVLANTIVASALVLATPLFVVFGALSDKIGRKSILLAGCLLAVLLYVPVFQAVSGCADVKAKTLQSRSTPSTPKTTVAKKADTKLGILPGDSVTETKFGVSFTDGTTATEVHKDVISPDGRSLKKSVVEFADIKLNTGSTMAVLGLVFVLVALVTMVYGPMAALLVEMFPTKVRYSSMSLPYHLGNGVFGGLVPLISTAIVAATHVRTAGLYYPMAVAALTVVVGALFLPDKRDVRLSD
ncbi:MAG: MHS family MFS transporter [Armatimonadetes bacterium]|nr:MHS family MFS transporter [Armatimonadota bacterium]